MKECYFIKCVIVFFKVGDRIGMMRKSNSNLHLYINGLDQGVAATKVPTMVWGVIDLYGMTVKVSFYFIITLYIYLNKLKCFVSLISLEKWYIFQF